jgi:hypothetical protein
MERPRPYRAGKGERVKFEVDRNCAVKITGTYNGIRYEVCAHNFNPEPDSYQFRTMWATYVLLTVEQFEQFKNKIEDAPSNGGITLRQKITHEHLDCPPELRKKWNKPFYKIGDDFSHLWDHERGGWDEHDRVYMEGHIKEVIDFLSANAGTRVEGGENG